MGGQSDAWLQPHDGERDDEAADSSTMCRSSLEFDLIDMLCDAVRFVVRCEDAVVVSSMLGFTEFWRGQTLRATSCVAAAAMPAQGSARRLWPKIACPLSRRRCPDCPLELGCRVSRISKSPPRLSCPPTSLESCALRCVLSAANPFPLRIPPVPVPVPVPIPIPGPYYPTNTAVVECQSLRSPALPSSHTRTHPDNSGGAVLISTASIAPAHVHAVLSCRESR
jgi:hypothetical protein